MNLLTRIGLIFSNQEEKRLRALWRIGIHILVVSTLTTAFTLGLMLITLVGDAILGMGLAHRLMGVEAISLSQVPLILMVVVSAAAGLGILLGTFLLGKFIDRRPFRDFGLRFSKAWWVDFAFGLALGAVLMGLIFAFGWLTGNFRIIGFFESFSDGLGFFSGFLQGLFIYLLVGVYEELLSRGYHLINLSEGFYLKPIGKRWAILLAVLVSSSIFGLVHIFNPNASWVSTLNITIAGILFSLGLIFTGRLAIPIGLHITWNFFQGNVFGFPVSGVRYGGLLAVTDRGARPLITGTAFGPEGGLLGTAALLASFPLFWLWGRWRRSKERGLETGE